MQKTFIKIYAVLLTASLMIGLTACEKRESPTVSTQQTEETSGEKEEKNTAFADNTKVKYPQFVPSEIKNSPIFAELSKKDNVVFLSEREVVTAPTPFEQFWKKVEAGKSTDLYVYSFELPFGMFDNQIFCSHYLFDGKKCIKETSSAEGKTLYTDPVKKIEWSNSESIPVQLSLASKGGMMENSDRETYLQLINDRDIFPNFEEKQKVYETYLKPLYFAIVTDNTFQSLADIQNLPELMNEIIDFETDGKENYWSVYSEGICPMDDAFSLLSRYFDITKEELDNICSEFVQDDGIFYQGGLGGAYPSILVKDTQTEGEISRITLCTRSVIDNSLGEDHVVTIKHLPDGTFHYVSLQ